MRHRATCFVVAAIGSTMFSAAMVVTHFGLIAMSRERLCTLTPTVRAMPVVAAVGVSALFFAVPSVERPTERPVRGVGLSRPDLPRDERFIRAFRIGRRANAVGRNRAEAARIWRAALLRADAQPPI